MTDMPPYLETKDEEKNSEHSDSESSDSDDWDVPKCFDQPRHLEPIKGDDREEHSWRVKEKYKTHCVALVLCLNVGVDPPDVVKTNPCARVECWIDPAAASSTKALESIGHALQAQYERWQPRARYKHSLDPTSDDVKKLCCSLRRNAKDERVLFHYNGHGVPKPTAQGEIWVFNRTYTQYIPLSIYDLQAWMGAPSLYVYDCSHAGAILDSFRTFAETHEKEAAKTGGTGISYRNCIQLGACAAGQSLPMNPELPADLFTACLTTPVKMAMKWFALRNTTRVATHNIQDLIDKIPGQVTDRRTMLGELNWIFTAVTDTIAWSSLPAELFTQLFRADLLTASLCRNFLVAERIMRAYNCTPVSSPALPALAQHPLWAAWDHTLDLALAQLPDLLAGRVQYTHSPFFRDQLTAFQVWLDLGSVDRGWPQQLPMVLQVLLSTLHRLRALRILVRFLALGTWAARAVLDVGIFPYMLKLLQASAPDLRPSMLHIWSRLVAVAPSCQVDLVNAKGHKYFLAILQDPTVDSEQKTLAAYVLAHIVDNYPPGQEAALQGGMISACLEQACDGGAGAGVGAAGAGWARVWACLACARAWRGYSPARMAAARDLAHEKLCPLLLSVSAELRAAAAHALGALLHGGAAAARADHDTALDHHVALHLAARLPRDASPLVRHEILAALQWIILIFEQHFIAVYIQERSRITDKESRRGRVDPGQDALATGARSPRSVQNPPLTLPAIGFGSVYTKLWTGILQMAREPHPQTAQMAQDLIAYVAQQVEAVGRDTETSSLPSNDQARSLPGHGRTRTKSSLPHTLSEDSVSSRDRDQRDSTSSTSSNSIKKPIVRTYLAEWACARFVRGDNNGAGDCESRHQHELAWRRRRNKQADMQAAALARSRPPKLESQAYFSRCVLPPTALQFHPYEQQVAVATKDNFGVWDWGCGARLCAGGWQRAWGRLAALAHLPAGLIAAGGQPGNVAIFRTSGGGGGGGAGVGGGAGGGGGPEGGGPQLVAAWRALHVTPAPDPRPPPAMPIYSLTKLMTDQFTTDDASKQPESALNPTPVESTQSSSLILRWMSKSRHLAVCGRAPTIRLWDCHAEMLAHDIPTECEAAATALSAGCGLLTAGFSNGCVSCWDSRCPTSTVFRLRPARTAILATCNRTHALNLVASGGEIQTYDTRKLQQPTSQVKSMYPLVAADIHPIADLIACGSTNQCISVYDTRGTVLNTIRFHEGFMGARIGPVSCLALHPLRAALGAGGKDATLSVYTPPRPDR